MAREGHESEVLHCENCGEGLTDFLFMTCSPEEQTDSEVLCDHCGELSGISIAKAYEVSEA